MPHRPPLAAPRCTRSPWISIIALLGFVVLFMAVAFWNAWPSWEKAFRSDASPVSWLSSALLLSLATTSLRLGHDRALPAWLALWLALAMGVLALDEQFMWHELWKFRCIEWTAWCEHTIVREAPMLCVGLLGLASMVVLHRHLPLRASRCLLWLGFATGAWALVLDQWSHAPFTLALLEEAFEVCAEALVLAALLSQPPGPPTVAPA